MGAGWRGRPSWTVIVAGAACVSSLALCTSPAHAQNPDADLTAAEQAYVDLDFDKAVAMAQAVTHRGGLTHAELVRAYQLLGRAQAVLDHDDEARAAFLKLLTYSPDEKEDRNLPPRVAARMNEARTVLSAYASRPGLEVLPVLVAGAAGSLRVITHDPTHLVQHLLVGWRWGGGEFITARPAASDGVEVPLPPAPPLAARLDYYASALDEHDDVIFEVGSAGAPKTAFAPAPPPPPAAPSPLIPSEAARDTTAPRKPVTASPVFWTITAGVLACIGTGTYFALRKPRQELSPPTGTDLMPTLVCGNSHCP